MSQLQSLEVLTTRQARNGQNRDRYATSLFFRTGSSNETFTEEAAIANREQQLALPAPRTYTRTDFTALRAFVQRIDVIIIAQRYFDPDATPHAANAEVMGQYLRTMLDDLVQLALRNGSVALASHLRGSIKQHGSAKLTAVTLRMVEQASTLAAAAPAREHAIGLWFRPLVAKRLSGEGIDTLGQLIDYCNSHGVSPFGVMAPGVFAVMTPPETSNWRVRTGIKVA